MNWRVDSSRNSLARMFEHRLMAKASDRILDSRLFPFAEEDPAIVRKLRSVAEVFGRLQGKRHIADYDNATYWTHTSALDEVKVAVDAFATWHSIKNETIAQDYLVSLLIKPRS
jgi:hypothetical protein